MHKGKRRKGHTVALMEELSRVELLIGKDRTEKLKNASVCVFGMGGVGGFAAEALARSGVGKITVFDNDVVVKSNLNRQIIATTQTLGKKKTDAIKERLTSINPFVKVSAVDLFYLPENADEYPFDGYDYVIDAVDTVTAKLEIIERAKKAGVSVISSMGTGGKLFPERLKVADISETRGCPLARVMRRELKKRGITKLKTVFSDENSVCAEKVVGENGKTVPPSMIFVPATAGLLLAREVIMDLIDKTE